MAVVCAMHMIYECAMRLHIGRRHWSGAVHMQRAFQPFTTHTKKRIDNRTPIYREFYVHTFWKKR